MREKRAGWSFVLLALSLCAAGTTIADGVLVHRYSFNDGTARDSVGQAGGKIVGHVRIEGGQARFDGSAGERIELPAHGPRGINIDTFHAVTLEAWFTPLGNRGWERVFDFGTSVAAANGASNGAHYLFFVPHTGFFNDARAGISDKDRSREVQASTTAVASGAETYAAVVVDERTITLYINGTQEAQSPLTRQKLSALSSARALLGASLFDADPTFFGSINEFRIYDVAANAAQIHASYQAGPDKVVIAQAGDSAVSAPAHEPEAVLQIDASDITATASPLHAGLMTEEINHSYDGGLYAELISNRAMQDECPVSDASPPHWTAVAVAGAEVTLRNDVDSPLNDQLDSTLRVEVKGASQSHRAGVSNDGFWGIPVGPNRLYHLSFYGKAAAGFSGPLTVSIESVDGSRTFAQTEVSLMGEGWHRYAMALSTNATVPVTAEVRLVIATGQPGTFWLDLVSLFPSTFHDRPNGNRIDLMEKLAALHPSFLRFPGGNYLEGDTFATRFDWKKSVGSLAQRPTHQGPWKYHSSDGLGLYEFLLWCEDLHMEPVLGVFAGNALGNGQFVKPGDELQPYVQDALDEVEYITGDISTIWGARRAADGHPAPFHLNYVEIGNEDGNRASNYDGRFAQFFDALKGKYPSLQLIATAEVKSRRPDVLDEHYYRHAQEFFDDVNHYDRYDRRGPKILVGEWATTEGRPTPNLHAALGDAAWMTGMERNSDMVIMQAYAPLLANVNRGGYEWPTNLIGYDALKSYGSPSYYAQLMFNAHRGDAVVEASLGIAPGLFYSVTRDTRTGALYIKAVNSGASSRTVRIELAGVKAVEPSGRQWLLAGDPADTNSLDSPERIVPVESMLHGLSRDFEQVFPAYSISVLQLQIN